MIWIFRKWRASRRAATAVLASLACLTSPSSHASEAQLFAAVSERAPLPIGWTQFCATYAKVCDTRPSTQRDIVFTEKAWNDLVQVNRWVNHNIKPITDMDHYGMIQWWRYPDDGSGACHSYALLKRRMLMQSGWPREALLMTIVREDYGRGDGHAVLTVKTDRGEFILDNLTDEIRLWSKTPYRFFKRQSQADPNTWVWLNDLRTEAATATGRVR